MANKQDDTPSAKQKLLENGTELRNLQTEGGGTKSPSGVIIVAKGDEEDGNPQIIEIKHTAQDFSDKKGAPNEPRET